MATNLQGSSHRPRAVGGAYDNRKDFIYEYDPEKRLTKALFNDNLLRSYEYDAFGNRTRLMEGDTETTYSYDVLDRLVERKQQNSGLDRIMSYEYDRRGNQTKEFVDGLLNKAFDFDATNMLTRVTDVSKGDAFYGYNGLGNRVSVESPEKKVDYLLDLTKRYHNMLERSVDGEAERYIYDSNVVSMSRAGESYFYLQDELGSGMYLTGTDGLTAEAYAYDEFGRNLNPHTGKREKPGYTKNGNIIQPLAFTGYQQDEMSERYYAQARYYDPETGRFVSKDSDGYIWQYKTKTLNLYEYCFNGPVDKVDLTGHYTAAEGMEAHIFIEAYALEFIPGCNVEYPIMGGSYHGNGPYGFADILIFNGDVAEIYEVKPGSYAETAVNHEAGIAQLEGYVRAFNNVEENKERSGMSRAKVGTSYDAYFQEIYVPSTINPGEYIVYRVYGDGLIIYNYVKSKPENANEYEPNWDYVAQVAPNYAASLDDAPEDWKEIADAIDFMSKLAVIMAILAADDATGAGAIDDPGLAVAAVVMLIVFGVTLNQANQLTDGDCPA